MTRRPLTLALLLALGACGPLVQIGGNAEPPASLLTLRAASLGAPAVAIDPARSLVIAQPSVPGTLQTLRLPVTTSDTEVQYLKGATWVEQPSKLFQRLLVDTVGASGGVLVLSERQSDVAAARKLTGQLLEFGLDARGAPQVSVRYDALLSGSDGNPVAARRFEATRPVAGEDPATIGAAINAAANQVAGEVAAWVTGS
ncbi:MAG: ABC-type transport auxiliary lipoprotein family protein [Sphingomonadaceae bacterium]|nr:ABC-type transport auxiliary lipoprotein family protein [Sphingomonadaceae bacterium]